MIRTKRTYEQATEDDGFRVLVDRLWPRGLTKEKARVDLWLKEVAPTDELRKWFHHDPKMWEKFRKKYEIELKEKQELLRKIERAEKDKGVVTLLYSAKDREHNNAVALVMVIKSAREKQ